MFNEYFTEKMRSRIESIYKKVNVSKDYSFNDSEEILIAELIKNHPTFISHWESSGFDEFSWNEKDINPFIHILMHYVVEKLLKSNSETAKFLKSFYSARKRKFMKHHDITHMLAQIIAENLFKEKRKQSSFNLETLHADLKKYSDWNKKKFWDHFIPEGTDIDE